MPAIPDLRAAEDLLLSDAPLDADAIDALIDAAYADDGRLDRAERARLRALLWEDGERLTPAGAEKLDLLDRLENATLRDAARRLAADGELSLADVAELEALARADDRISKREQRTLDALLDYYAGLLTPEAKVALGRLAGRDSSGAGGPVDTGEVLTLAPDLYWLPHGPLSTRPDHTPDSTRVEPLGDVLYRAARLIDDLPADGRLFETDEPGRAAELQSQLSAAVRLGADPPPGTASRQALQLRSSGFTCLVHLIECLPNDGPPGDASLEAEQAALRFAREETHPALSEGFAYALHRVRGTLTAEGRAAADTLYDARVPTAPPYGAWFGEAGEDGDDGPPTLVVHWSAGRGSEGFYRGTVELLERAGFELEDGEEAGASGPAWFRRDFGGELVVRLRLKEYASDVFASMDDPGVHVVGYDGHSDIGRNMRRSLRRAPDMQGAKLVFYGLCAGKDALFRVRARYPEAQILTSFNSSYFRTAEGPDGQRRMVESENFNALMEVLRGIVERDDWAAIREAIRKNAIPPYWRRLHALPGGMNYITPIDTGLTASVLDSDRDGQADALDRVIDFNAFDVVDDTAAEFTARDPGHPPHALDGTDVHIAANVCNTAMLYNPLTKKYNARGRIVGGGYADFGLEPGIVRVVDLELDGEPAWALEVSHRYAHMSEEALRAVALYAWNAHVAGRPAEAGAIDGTYRERWRSSTWRDAAGRPDLVDVRLMGLTLAMFTLTYDMNEGFAGLHRRDVQIWEGLLRLHHLPDLDHRPIWKLIWDEKHDYAGSPGIVGGWREGLTPATVGMLGISPSKGDAPSDAGGGTDTETEPPPPVG